MYLALLTPGSYVSEICRAEQLRSLRKRKCVIPLKAQRGTDFRCTSKRRTTATSLPTAATHRPSPSCSKTDSRATESRSKRFRQTYVTVPPLPVNFVERPEALSALRDALITDDSGRHIALTALEGMGGIGKTVLAQALCHDEVVQQAFPDGVVWITIGKESAFDVVTRLREVGKALGDDLSRYENELASTNQYRSTIRKKAALIVIDDVWRSSDLEPFLAEDSPRSRLLFTTRDANIAAAVGAREHVADLLTDEQSREVLARWSHRDYETAAHRCPTHPRVRTPSAGAFHGGRHAARQAATIWKRVLDLLRNADLDKIRPGFPDYPYPNLLAAIQVSVDSLDAQLASATWRWRCFWRICLPAPAIQQCLWRVDENEAAETAGQLVRLSLAQRDRRMAVFACTTCNWITCALSIRDKELWT